MWLNNRNYEWCRQWARLNFLPRCILRDKNQEGESSSFNLCGRFGLKSINVKCDFCLKYLEKRVQQKKQCEAIPFIHENKSSSMLCKWMMLDSRRMKESKIYELFVLWRSLTRYLSMSDSFVDDMLINLIIITS